MAYIASGTLKRSKLKVPRDDVRPTQRLLRLAIFNFLDDFTKDASVLDLFAGTGAFGIEALSRGARKVIFVDIAEKSYQAIKENIFHTKVKDATAVYKMDALLFLMKSIKKNRKFDIIFIDPPFTELYKMDAEKRENFLIEILDRSRSLLNPKSLVIMKYPKKFILPLPTGLIVAEERRYGINKVAYLVQKEFIANKKLIQ